MAEKRKLHQGELNLARKRLCIDYSASRYVQSS